MMPLDVSIIVVSYNTGQLLRGCLTSIFTNTRDVEYEVIVVDNGSTDGSPQLVEREFPDARLIRIPTNTGFAAANNAGYRSSSGRYVFLLNSDARLLGNAAARFLEFMERPEQRDVAVCGGRLIGEDGQPVISCGNFPSLLEFLVWLFRLNLVLPPFIKRRFFTGLPAEGKKPYAMPVISGAAFFVRRSALGNSLPFDSDFFLYFEEAELCFRLRARGFRALVVPEVRIVHLCGRSGVQLGVELAEIYERSKLLYFAKCKGPRSAALVRAVHCIVYFLRYVLAHREVDRRMMKFYWTRGLLKRLALRVPAASAAGQD